MVNFENYLMLVNGKSAFETQSKNDFKTQI